jgi:hypothetical protein
MWNGRIQGRWSGMNLNRIGLVKIRRQNERKTVREARF